MKLPLLITLLLIASTAPLVAQPTAADLSSLAQIRTGVKSKRVSSSDPTGGNRDRVENIADGETRLIADIKGAGVITHIWMTYGTFGTPSTRPNMNDVILKIYWDGQKEPSVLSPIGPFFGQGWNEAYPLNTAPLAVAMGEPWTSLVSYFNMPFSKGARFEIENQSGTKIGVFYFYIDYTAVEKLPADAGRFHAWYNRQITDADPETGENEWGSLGPTKPNTTNERNYLIADIKGQGQFVGLNYYVHSPSPMWYGEGDDVIEIDGDAASTLKGTGTEDYFNTAWSPKQLFQHPYFGLARVNNDLGWLGRTHAYRFHIVDPIYFEKSLKFTIEHGHNNVLTLDLATVAYWYQSEAVGVPAIPDKAARALMPMIEPMDIHRWRDAWRKQMGGGGKLWGKETPEQKRP
ncbi:glycoside hydrolase family 172 protein [Oleiharenicola lentus]|uniref:glycoside hydrolase family 172 protein n=1 Tax=Oleiharenicola lentus TaxID=2508720 RepID=UPI003F67CF4E